MVMSFRSNMLHLAFAVLPFFVAVSKASNHLLPVASCNHEQRWDLTKVFYATMSEIDHGRFEPRPLIDYLSHSVFANFSDSESAMSRERFTTLLHVPLYVFLN